MALSIHNSYSSNFILKTMVRGSDTAVAWPSARALARWLRAAPCESRAPMSAPPDHYSVLGVPSDATADDVAAQARRVRTEFHPDKFSRDAAAQQSAEAAFKRASDAFEVLGDSASRAIYDRFGHDGVQEAKQLGLVGRSSALSTSLRTPAETVEKYALNRRLRKEKELASDLGIGGNMNMRLDAARLFALPRYAPLSRALHAARRRPCQPHARQRMPRAMHDSLAAAAPALWSAAQRATHAGRTNL